MMRRVTLMDAFLFSLLLFLPPAGISVPAFSAPAAAQTGNAISKTIERELAWNISEPRMQATVRMLCGLGPRMGGTNSNSASAGWLAGEFRKYGLEVEIREDPLTSFHEVDEWEVAIKGGDRILSAWPRNGSPSASGTGSLSTEPGEGVVWLTSENLNAEASETCLAVLYDGRPTPSGWPGAGGLRGEWKVPVFGISSDESRILRSRLEQDQQIQVTVNLEARSGRASPKTVIATIAGRDRSRFFLFCAHGDSDSGGPGADDNASGVAIILEIARTISSAIDAGIIERPAYDIRFAPWGSEISSTRDYVRELLENGEMPEAVINYDQSGFGSWRDALYFEPDDVPENEEIIRLLRTVAMDHVDQPGFPMRFASIRSQGGTDSYVFQQRRIVGENIVPSVTVYNSAWNRLRTLEVTPGFPPVNWYEEEEGMVTVDGDAFYHSAGDTPENTTDTEPWNMGWCARIGMITALRLMESG